MEHSQLHQDKIKILGRLIKESSLTLEEALLLLQPEEEKEPEQPVQQYPTYPGGTTTYWPHTFNMPLTGHGTITTGIGSTTTATSNTNGQYFTTTNLNTPSTLTASVLQELEKAIEDADL